MLLAGRNWSIRHLPNVDSLLDELLAKGPHHPDMIDEKLPYWAEIWPSSIALAETILNQPGHWAGQSGIELGCGPGLAGLAALSLGAKVLFTDWMNEALDLASLNVRTNLGLEADVLLMDWRRPLDHRQFDFLLAADCTYEERFFDDFIACLETLLMPEGHAWLAEPGRLVAREFFRRLAKNGWVATPLAAVPDRPGVWKVSRRSCVSG